MLLLLTPRMNDYLKKFKTNDLYFPKIGFYLSLTNRFKCKNKTTSIHIYERFNLDFQSKLPNANKKTLNKYEKRKKISQYNSTGRMELTLKFDQSIFGRNSILLVPHGELYIEEFFTKSPPYFSQPPQTPKAFHIFSFYYNLFD